MERKVDKKVLLIGLDGTTWKVIKPWVDWGFLPTLQTLMENGTWGVLESTIPCLSSPAIPSFFTGKNPAKLGFFDFVKPDGTLVSYRDIKEPAIWDILGDYGYKSMVVNVRTTYPPKKINGIMISGMPPSEESEYTYPPDLKKKVDGFHLENGEFRRLWRAKIFSERLLSLYVQRMRRRYEIVKSLVEEKDYDFILYWIEGTDSIQHWYWHQKEALLLFFREVDKILGDLVKTFPNRELFLISDHGFHGPATYDFYVNSWLQDEGYLKLRGGKLRQWLTYKVYSWVGSRLGRILYKFFRSLKRNQKKVTLPKNEEEPRLPQKENIYFLWGINPDDTLAVAHGTNPPGIMIIKENLTREQDYEKIREEIINKLNHLTIDGKKVMQNAWKREDIFHGRYISQVPDIVYLASEDLNATSALSKNALRKRKKIGPIGSHDRAREGIFLAYGRDVKQGMKLGEANITDIAPTILHLYNVPVPEDMDGRVLKEIFKEDSEASQRPVRYQRVSEKERLRAKIRKLKALRNL